MEVTPFYMLERVREGFLGAKSFDKFQLGSILWFGTVLNLNGDWFSELAQRLALKPKDSTDKMSIFRKLIMTGSGGHDLNSTLVHTIW